MMVLIVIKGDDNSSGGDECGLIDVVLKQSWLECGR